MLEIVTVTSLETCGGALVPSPESPTASVRALANGAILSMDRADQIGAYVPSTRQGPKLASEAGVARGSTCFSMKSRRFVALQSSTASITLPTPCVLRAGIGRSWLTRLRYVPGPVCTARARHQRPSRKLPDPD